jgi:ceramidase
MRRRALHTEGGCSLASPSLCYPVSMTLGSVRINLPILVFSGLAAASLAGLLLPPIPQDQSYHQFADQRSVFGIPNFWNVISNLPFLAVGAAGLRRFRDDPASVVFFLGVFLTGIGSSYYHWNPNDNTLFWDRLPMTLSFAAIFALVVKERVNTETGTILLWPALAIGLFSLLLWRWSDDLRLYFWMQFFPGLALILLFLLHPPKYTGTSYWIVAVTLYALAKVFEFSDKAIYSAGNFLSGHTLKHFAAAAACFAILRYFGARQPILQEQQARPIRVA